MISAILNVTGKVGKERSSLFLKGKDQNPCKETSQQIKNKAKSTNFLISERQDKLLPLLSSLFYTHQLSVSKWSQRRTNSLGLEISIKY